jgi:site-specific recombinase XerD
MPQLPIVKIQPQLHRNSWWIFIYFEYDSSLIQQIRKIKATYSNSHKAWYVGYTIKDLENIYSALKDVALIEDSKVIEASSGTDVKTVTKSASVIKSTATTPNVKVNEIQIPERYLKTLLHRRFSDATFKTYTSLFKRFMVYFKDEELDLITKDQIVDYLLHLIKTKNISTSTQNQVINAIKFYYEKVLNRESQKYWINRPQREFKLPTILSEEEVLIFMKAITNIKHLTIVSLLYSAGLRRGEIINLKKGDIDMNRKQIKVAKGKGKKDRMTVLSAFMGELLVKYVKEYKPTYWLFESPNRTQYSASSIAMIIKKAAKKAEITKHVTPHVLRHSFATHLMDQGIETRYIQTLLGHNSIETTALYTYVSTRSIEQIKSPLDKILERKMNPSSPTGQSKKVN